jgi:hypothetical protein
MSIATFAAASLLVLGASAAAAAQAPTPTPRTVIRIGRPAGGAGVGRPSSTGSSSTALNTGHVSTSGQSGTLICRMGGGMVWTLVNQFDVVSTQLAGKNVRVPVVVALFDQLKFAKSGALAQPDASNLQPGFCGFTDRAMTASDPDTVICDDDDFMFNETVLWGNGSTIKGETTMFGGSLSFQNKQPFSMQVTLFNGVQWKVATGTKPKQLK